MTNLVERPLKKDSPEYWRAVLEIWRDAYAKVGALTKPRSKALASSLLSDSEEDIR